MKNSIDLAPSPLLAAEWSARWQKIQSALQQQGEQAILLACPTNLLYALGRVLSGYLYIPGQGEPTLFVRRPLGLRDPHIVYIRKPEDIPAHLAEAPRQLMLELDELSYNEAQRLLALFPGATVGNGSTLMREVRSVKTPYEIEQHIHTAARHAEALALVPSL